MAAGMWRSCPCSGTAAWDGRKWRCSQFGAVGLASLGGVSQAATEAVSDAAVPKETGDGHGLAGTNPL